MQQTWLQLQRPHQSSPVSWQISSSNRCRLRPKPPHPALPTVRDCFWPQPAQFSRVRAQHLKPPRQPGESPFGRHWQPFQLQPRPLTWVPARLTRQRPRAGKKQFRPSTSRRQTCFANRLWAPRPFAAGGGAPGQRKCLTETCTKTAATRSRRPNL